VRNGRPSLKDVAEAAGVSISTVSRAFSNPERLSAGTVEHVTGIARTMRYTPNLIGRALQAGTSPYVGVVVPDIANPYMSTLVKAVQARARRRDVGVFLADTDDSAETEREVGETLARQTRGLLLCAPRMSTAHIRELDALVPLVLVNRVVTGIPSYVTDSAGAYAELVDELTRLGHRTVAYLPGPTGSWADRARHRAVADRCAENGLTLVALPATAASLADGIAAAGPAVDAGSSAVIAFDDVLAAGVIEGLRRRGLSVPDDLSVAGHDDVLAGLVQPALTTITSHGREVGERALDRLLDRAANEDAGPNRVGIAGELAVRGSLGPPPRGPGRRRR
jgi:DNA-binding LacI/PurR family transcriptional regulator